MASRAGSPSILSPSRTPTNNMTRTLEPVTERSPLLPSNRPTSTETHEDEDEESSPVAPVIKDPHKYIWRLCFILFALVQAADSLILPPLAQLKELSSCKSHYGDGWSLGRDCKVDAVQDEVTTLIGWQQLFDTAPGILFGAFYGIAADRYGRRPILALALVGLIMSAAWTQLVLFWSDVFPVRITWISSVFQLVGGGSLVVKAMVLVMVADITPDEKRATKFFRLYAVSLLSDMVLSPASGALANIQPWWPARLGLIALMMAILTVWLLLPETFELRGSTSSGAVGTLLVEEEPEDEDDPVIYANVQKNAFWRGIRVVLTRLHDLRFLWGSRRLLVLIPLLSVGQLYDQSADFFMQYVSKRYNWRISQASFLLSYRNVVNLILLSAIMPAVSSILLRRGYDARSKDLWISRASILALANGAFIIGLSPIISMLVIGLTVFALGHGFVPVVVSLATSFIEPEHTGLLYTAMGISEAIGKLANGPLLTGSFELGMRVGGSLQGLPFVVTGIMLTVSGVNMFVLRLPEPVNHLD